MSDRMAGILEEIGKYLQREEPINPQMMPRSYMPESNVMSLAPYMAKGLINDVARYGKQAFTGEVSDRELLPQQPLTGDAKAVADAFGSGVGKALNYQVPTLKGSRSVMDDINMVVNAYRGARPGIVEALGEPSVNRVEGAGLLGSMFIPAKVPKPKSGGLFSQAVIASDNLQRKTGNADGFFNDLTGKGQVKPDELNAMGFKENFAGRNDVTRDEVRQFVNDNQVQIKETRLGVPLQDRYVVKNDPEGGFNIYDSTDPAEEILDRYGRQETAMSAAATMNRNENVNTSKFGSYTLDGGDNYREILLQDNSATRSLQKPFINSSHFDEPNILAHLRMKDRVDTEGNKTLLIEEAQSDWHQKGADVGYKPKDGSVSKPLQDEMDRIEQEMGTVYEASRVSDDPDVWMPLNEQFDNLNSELGRLKHKADEGVPDAPFKTDDKSSWYNLAMKRGLLEAVEGGYDKLALTTGRQQAERYDLSKQINEVRLSPFTMADGKSGYTVSAFDKSDSPVIMESIDTLDQLPNIIGKDAAKAIIEQPKVPSKFNKEMVTQTLAGQDLSVGGEGMKQFYDRTLPNALGKLVKQDGVKVGQSELKHPNAGDGVNYEGFNRSEVSELDRLGELVLIGRNTPDDLSRLQTLLAKEKPRKGDFVHSIDITPKMRERVKKGLPLFATGGAAIGLTEMMSQQQQEDQRSGLFNSLQY